MRVSALHRDVVVATSAVWQTNCTLVRGAEEAFCVDSPVLPHELDALPALAEQSGFRVVGLLATHADWDHLLGRLAFPDAALGCAPSSAQRLRDDLGAAQRALRDFDEEHYVARVPLALPAAQELPVPGHVELGEGSELELHPAEGHTGDGMAILVPWARVLVAGDYLSPVEIPMLSPGGSVEAYLETLERLAGLLGRADHVVPGHGAPVDAATAARVLAEDRAYLEALRVEGERAPLPPGRRSATQRKIHAANVERVPS